MCKVYSDVGGIKQLYDVYPPVRKITNPLKPLDYLHVHADDPWYNYYLNKFTSMFRGAAIRIEIRRENIFIYSYTSDYAETNMTSFRDYLEC